MRVLLVSWEFPPVVEGGLGRHVGKLAAGLAREEAVEVHVLTRGRDGDAAEELRDGVHVHRVPEPRPPRDLEAFVAWVRAMNADLLARGAALGRAHDFDLVHGHDWLVAVAAKRLADRLGRP